MITQWIWVRLKSICWMNATTSKWSATNALKDSKREANLKNMVLKNALENFNQLWKQISENWKLSNDKKSKMILIFNPCYQTFWETSVQTRWTRYHLYLCFSILSRNLSLILMLSRLFQIIQHLARWTQYLSKVDLKEVAPTNNNLLSKTTARPMYFLIDYVFERNWIWSLL